MLHESFRQLARRVSNAVGSPIAFVIAVGVCVLWAVSGPFVGFSDTWQLVINTATTLVTFLMVFLIQNTQNHDSRALHLKLDELLRAVQEARNSMVDIESLDDAELARMEAEFRRVRLAGKPPRART